MARRQRIDSAASAVVVMAASTRTIVPPQIVKLKRAELPFFESVAKGRPKSDWNDVDLITAAQLAKVLCAIEGLRADQVADFDKLARLSLAMRRSLGLDVRGKDGRASDVSRRREIANGMEADSPFGDELLARPAALN